MKVDSNNQGNAKHWTVFFLSGVFLLSGCASSPSPSTTLPFARAELEASREDGLSEFSPLEIKIAQDKVEQAEQAANSEQHEQAERLSQQALSNLKLAEAKADAKKAEKIADELDRNISTLRQELDR